MEGGRRSKRVRPCEEEAQKIHRFKDGQCAVSEIVCWQRQTTRGRVSHGNRQSVAAQNQRLREAGHATEMLERDRGGHWGAANFVVCSA